jgi:glycosyltransferase involved in cell wall biosynthesis
MTTKPRILFLSSAPYRGGAEDYMVTMALYCKQQLDWDVHVLLRRSETFMATKERLLQAGVVVDQVSIIGEPKGLSSILNGLRRGWGAVQEGYSLYQYLGRKKPHVVHINLHGLSTARVPLFIAALMRIPAVGVIQSAPQKTRLRFYARRFYRVLDWFGMRWITVCEDSRRNVAESLGLAPQHIAVIPNGVPIGRFAFTADDRASQRHALRQQLHLPDTAIVATTVARLDGLKGHDVLARAVPAVIARFPNTHFLWVGEGPFRAECERILADLQVSDHVVFAGHRADIPALLAASDLFAFPTFRESLPFALLEAMAAGLPCVASAVNGIPEVVRDGTDGLLVEPRNVDALAQAILRVLADEGLARRLGVAARERSHLFGQEQMCERTAAFYQELLNR